MGCPHFSDVSSLCGVKVCPSSPPVLGKGVWDRPVLMQQAGCVVARKGCDKLPD